ncbi:hypothetical protein [Comamonas terrigena]|uniref:hypothetical protein n=1 Tax=Comamonas terrigena TaxID=32013 RepID=UPI00289BB5EC|nr:hypothetical protein [Comamonas terrigena]
MLKRLIDALLFDNRKLEALLARKEEREHEAFRQRCVEASRGPGEISSCTGLDDSLDACRPVVNIDGTPMVGDIDINGNPFGVTNDDSFCSGNFGGGFNNDF